MAIESPSPLIFEGHYIQPSDAPAYPKEFVSIFLGYPAAHLSKKTQQIRLHALSECYTNEFTDEVLTEKVRAWIEFGRHLSDECVQSGTIFLDTSTYASENALCEAVARKVGITCVAWQESTHHSSGLPSAAAELQR